MTQDHVYWLFSSLFQGGAAFAAFTLSGFALVQAMMDNAAARDESLDQVHAALKAQHYTVLRAFSICILGALLSSVTLIFCNGPDVVRERYPIYLSLTLNIAALLFGVVFVFVIVDPNRYRRAARQILDRQSPVASRRVGAAEFIERFISLEVLVRALFAKYVLVEARPATTGRDAPTTFRQMVAGLHGVRALSDSSRDELLDLARFRNLVFHGAGAEIDEQHLTRLEAATARLRPLLEGAGSSQAVEDDPERASSPRR